MAVTRAPHLQIRKAQPPCLTQVTLMGCRVDLDGGTAPKARMKATTFPPDPTHGQPGA